MSENIISIRLMPMEHINMEGFLNFQKNPSPQKDSIPPYGNSDFLSIISKSEMEYFLSLKSELNFILERFHDISFLTEKFDELREKEINNTLTGFERILLYEVIEKRILEFPNPYLPSHHEKAENVIKKLDSLEKSFNKKYKKKNHKIKKMFLWLGYSFRK